MIVTKIIINTDVDECSLGMNQCQQMCVNLNGSYSCECNEGYAVVPGRYYACEGNIHFLSQMNFIPPIFAPCIRYQ